MHIPDRSGDAGNTGDHRQIRRDRGRSESQDNKIKDNKINRKIIHACASRKKGESLHPKGRNGSLFTMKNYLRFDAIYIPITSSYDCISSMKMV